MRCCAPDWRCDAAGSTSRKTLRKAVPPSVRVLLKISRLRIGKTDGHASLGDGMAAITVRGARLGRRGRAVDADNRSVAMASVSKEAETTIAALANSGRRGVS
jgi:precorrin-6B methylase 2